MNDGTKTENIIYTANRFYLKKKATHTNFDSFVITTDGVSFHLRVYVPVAGQHKFKNDCKYDWQKKLKHAFGFNSETDHHAKHEWIEASNSNQIQSNQNPNRTRYIYYNHFRVRLKVSHYTDSRRRLLYTDIVLLS